VTDKPVELDHRGMAAQKATELRRFMLRRFMPVVAANERTLRATHDALEGQLLAAPASNGGRGRKQGALSAVGACGYSERPR
jgi:hypothetical protein